MYMYSSQLLTVYLFIGPPLHVHLHMFRADIALIGLAVMVSLQSFLHPLLLMHTLYNMLHVSMSPLRVSCFRNVCLPAHN